MTSLVPGLHVHSHFNAEEAAHAASEFVASLDNLPGEVNFLLEEIKEKDTRINFLVTRISSRHGALTRHAKNLSSQSAAPSSSTLVLPIPPGDPLPIEHLSSKDQLAVNKIVSEWAKVEALQEEKRQLAERLERIVSRARERGKAEWSKVGGMDLDEMESEHKVVLGELGGGEVMLPPGGLGSGSDARSQKKKRPSALPPLPLPSASYPLLPIIHPPASMPPPSAPHNSRLPPSARGSARSSRLERHVSASPLSDLDGDGEGEGEVEVAEQGDGEEDATLYCICQQKSYGEMIGCDNEACKYEWFHLKCVNISGPVPETWYCPDCVRRSGLSSHGQMAGKQDKKNRKR